MPMIHPARLLAAALLVAGTLPARAAGAGDLRAATFTATLRGDTLTLDLEICNDGAASGPVSVGLWLDRDRAPACGDAADASADVSFGAGACERATLTVPGVPRGAYRA